MARAGAKAGIVFNAIGFIATVWDAIHFAHERKEQRTIDKMLDSGPTGQVLVIDPEGRRHISVDPDNPGI